MKKLEILKPRRLYEELTHDPEIFMFRLRERFKDERGSNVIHAFTRFCDRKGIEYEVTLR